MNFKCLKNKEHSFSVPKPVEIEGIWHWRGLIKCVYCGSEDLEEDLAVSTVERDRENIRKENRELTQQAMRMAQEARIGEANFNPDVAITPVENPSRFGGGTFQVKKSIIDSIQSKKPVDAP
jgi:hypothetical protein